MDANVEAIESLEEDLKERGYDFAKIPYALQFNKRDLRRSHGRATEGTGAPW